MTKLTRLLTAEEFRERNDWGTGNGYWHADRRLFPPGTGWLQPWYYDPTGQWPRQMIREKGRLGFLSEHYWRDWADRRPPISVVGPNGESWEIDRKSSNGTGWTVTGDWPNITCSPSIVLDGYHGFLRDGEFTADVEGRGPIGIVRAIAPRGAETPIPEGMLA